MGLQVCLMMVLWVCAIAGCKNAPDAAPHAGGQVPQPINLLLPRQIRIHPFTGTRTFAEAGGIRGIDVRIEAIDAYDDTTKAYGNFRFELYAFRGNSLDPKGEQLTVWNVPLSEPDDNLLHWDSIIRAYKFKLQWDQPIPVGRQFVLVAVFSSRFTERLFDQRVFVAGQ